VADGNPKQNAAPKLSEQIAKPRDGYKVLSVDDNAATVVGYFPFSGEIVVTSGALSKRNRIILHVPANSESFHLRAYKKAKLEGKIQHLVSQLQEVGGYSLIYGVFLVGRVQEGTSSFVLSKIYVGLPGEGVYLSEAMTAQYAEVVGLN
jgi:hypothetical protein